MRLFIIWSAILIDNLFRGFTVSAWCDDHTVTLAIYTDLSIFNDALSASLGQLEGEAHLSDVAITLTNTSAVDAGPRKGYGGFFLKESINFQDEGGFSVLFGIRARGGLRGGDAWDFVLADAGERQILPPPYGIFSTSYGHAGWSRKKAMVVEFMNVRNSASSPTLSGTNITIYLDGVQAQGCTTHVAGLSVSSGQLYYVWVDYFGLFSMLDIRVSTSQNRPRIASLRCTVDIWAVLDINSRNYIGFEAYNPLHNTGAAHTISDIISVVDAYRYIDPENNEQCVVYGPCSLSSRDSICTQVTDPFTSATSDTCYVFGCPPSYYYDEAGIFCCAFAEGGSWIPIDRTVPAGVPTTCVSKRATKVFLAPPTRCITSQ